MVGRHDIDVLSNCLLTYPSEISCAADQCEKGLITAEREKVRERERERGGEFYGSNALLMKTQDLVQ